MSERKRGRPKSPSTEETVVHNVRLPISLFDRLAVEAVREGVPISKVIRERILRSFIATDSRKVSHNIH